MKIAIRTLLIVALAALPLTAVSGDLNDALQLNLDETLGDDFSQDFAGGFQMGGYGVDAEGAQEKVSEYTPNESSPAMGVLFDSHNDGGTLEFNFNFLQKKDFNGDLNFDIGRMVRSHNTYTKFIHRAPHDQMLNLEATSTNGKVVEHTDLDPYQVYGMTYENFDSRTEFQFDMLSALTLAVEYRNQKRNGHEQAYTTSHCDTCHVKSQDHKLEERTRDAKIEAMYGWQGGNVVASWNSRTLKYGDNSVPIQFDNALHPELQVPVFNNRLQYDDEVGTVPADLWPNQEKSTGRLDINLNNLGGFAVNLGGVLQDSKNSYTGYRAGYKGFMLNAARAFGKRTRVRWRSRFYSLNNDEVWVDVNDRVSIAGPHAGQTYEDWTGQNFDHMRKSAIDRDVFESRLDASFRMGKRAGTLRLGWDYKTNDRENYQVLEGETKTTKSLLGLYWRARPVKNFKLNAYYKYADITNPFMLVDGACSTLVSGSNSNPWDPDATAQYYEFQDARIAETTASPESWDEFKFGLTWTIATRTTLSGTYKYRDGSNQAGDLTNWSNTNQNATVTLWSGPTQTFSWYLGYAMTDSKRDAPVCIPVFDG